MKASLQIIRILIVLSLFIFALPSAYGAAICNSSSSTDSSGSLTDSGGSNGNYSNNESCNFVIQPVGANTVTLTFSNFDLERGYDFVTIYDGSTTDDPVLASRLSGANLPASVTSTGGSMLIRFTSDISTTQSGFISSWSSTAGTASRAICNSSSSTDTTGTLTDSGGSRGNYSDDESCNFLIQPDGASVITFSFSAFNLESGYDFVTVYDGPTTSSPVLANRLSGTILPANVTSTGGSMLIRFTSDSSSTRSGFIASWSLTSERVDAMCNSSSSSQSTGTLTDSGGSGGNYSNNESCDFLIQPDDASAITLSFSAFNLESVYDTVTVYDGSTTSSPVLANRLSGTNSPASVTSSGGSMLIRFTSDSTGTRSGFISHWSSTTGGGGVSCSAESVGDNFANISYSQNSGSDNWSGSWTEVGESDGTSSGIARVRNDLCTSGYCLRLGVPSDNNAQTFSNRGVLREIDLSDVSSATLSFVYRSGVLQGNETIVLSISDNGGASWTNLQSYIINSQNSSSSPTSASFDISSYTANNTQVRFLASGNNAIIGMYIDDININYQPTCTTLLMEYQFEETSWNGTLGEVIDNSGNGNHGQVISNSIPKITSPALTGNPGTCGYASQNDGSIQVTDLPLDTTTDGIKTTVTFWMNWDGTDNTIPIGWNRHNIWMRNGSMGFSTWSNDNYGISSANLANSWHHVAVEFTNGSVTNNRIYIDGVEQVLTQRFGSPNTSRAYVNSEMRAGGISNSSSYNFHGLLDEFRVYEGALTTAQVLTIMAERHVCNTSAIHHYEISHDGQGLTCDSESVIIKACTDQNCSNLSTESVSLDFLGNGQLIHSPTFVGSTTINFNHTTVEALSFSLANASIAASNAVVCDDGSGNSCDMAFEDAGFRFLYGAGNLTVLPNQKSGTVFGDALKVQAVKNTNGVCTGLFNGNKIIELSQANVEPGDKTGLYFHIDTNNLNLKIEKHNDVTNVTLNFDADSIATIPTPIYQDAGKIRLHANYNLGGVTLSGSSNPFWVIPARLEITAKSGAVVLDGNTATHSKTHKAGEVFDLTVSAYNATTPSVITQNYSPGQIELKLERTGPTSDDDVEGTLTYKQPPSSPVIGTLVTSVSGSSELKFKAVSLSEFTDGVSTSKAQYSEVGLIKLEVRDNNYGDDNSIISAEAINIGRFTPAYFKQKVVINNDNDNTGVLGTVCVGTKAMFAYSGQKNEAGDAGTISYDTHPVIAITAFNANDIPTQNYYNDYMKLTAENVYSGIRIPTLDQDKEGVDTNKLTLTASMKVGELSRNDLNTEPPNVTPLSRGVLHYKFSDKDNFYYNRSTNALVKSFVSNIKFSINAITDDNTIQDEDGIRVNVINDISPDGVEIRFGRLRLENSFGPETSDLPQPMQVEHFDGTNFVVSSDNDCLSYDKDNIELTYNDPSPLSSESLGDAGFFANGKTNKIRLKAPGAGNRGKIGVSYNTYDWLKYDWKNDGGLHNPTAVATFGLFRGNDRIIYWHEVSK